MRIISIKDNIFTDYKKTSMLISMPICCGKCYKEVNKDKSMCHNEHLDKSNIIDVSNQYIIDRYIKNPLSKAVIFGGKEPFDSFEDVVAFIEDFRKHSTDEIIIYSGYYKNEVKDEILKLKSFNNIIIKFGRYKPNTESIYSEVLGVKLASSNQYARRIENL